MAQAPVFTDASAYGRAVPGTPRVADASPIPQAVGNISQAAMGLAKIIYEQDQDKAILDARIGMSNEFSALRQKVAEETDYRKASEDFDKGAADIQAQYATNAEDGKTQNALRASYAEAYRSAQADAWRQITARRNSAFLATAEDRIKQLHQDAALDPDMALTAKKQEIAGIAEALRQTGVIDSDNAARMTRQSLSDLDNVRASWMVEVSPKDGHAALTATKNDGRDFTHFTDLDPLRRNALISQAEAGGRKNSANVDELQNQAVKNIWQGNGTGDPQVKEAYSRGMNGNRAQDFEGNVKAAQQAKAVLDEMRYKPLDKWEEQLSKFDENASKAGNEYLPKQARTLRFYAAELSKAWIEKPADTANQEFPLPKPPGDLKEWPLASRMAQRLSAMEAVGVANQGDKDGVLSRNRLLRTDELAGSISALKNQPPEGKALMMASLKREMGTYAAVGVAQLRKEGKLPAAYDRMGDPDVSPTGVQVLALTADVKEQDLVSVLPDPTADAKNIRAAVRKDFQEISMTFQTTADATEALEMTTKAALYYGREDPGRASDKAIKDVWGKVERIGTARLPVGLTPEQKTNVRFAIEDATRNVERFKPFLGDTPLGEYRRRIQDEGRWFTYTGDGGRDEGVELVWANATQVDTSGKPIRMVFADMASTKAPDKNAQQAAALADPRTRMRLSIGGNLPPTPGAR